MASFGRAKGKVLVLENGLTLVPYHQAGSGYDSVVICHTVLGPNDGANFVGRIIWVSRADIDKAEVIPSMSIIGLAAAYGSTHQIKE